MKIIQIIKILRDFFDLEILRIAETNIDWLNDNIEEIEAKYKEEFIAIYKSEVIVHNANLDNLLKKINELKIDLDLVEIEYIMPKGAAYIL